LSDPTTGQTQDDEVEPLTEEEREIVKKVRAQWDAAKTRGGKRPSATFIDRMTSSVADPDWVRRKPAADPSANRNRS
jgi:hypothetical protein